MERPILFNTAMVEAILEGRKTQTRRLVKVKGKTPVVEETEYGLWINGFFAEKFMPCRPGDTLYVRETWTKEGQEVYYRADFESDYLDPCETLSGGYPEYCRYHPGCEGCTRGKQRIHWHPSIHMPKAAARIWLRVKDVRCERLQDITIEEAVAEGMKLDDWYDYDEYQHQSGDGLASSGVPVIFETPLGFFGHTIWDNTMSSLEQYEKYGWDQNPWVWVIEFERIEGPTP